MNKQNTSGISLEAGKTTATGKSTPATSTSSISQVTSLYYDIVEYVKKTRANISFFKLAHLNSQNNLIFKALGGTNTTSTPTNTNTPLGLTTTRANQITISNMLNQPAANSALFGQKYKSMTPPFLLNFEVFNNKLRNCLVDSGAMTNVIPYFVCQKLNAQPRKCTTQIVELDKSTVQVMG